MADSSSGLSGSEGNDAVVDLVKNALAAGLTEHPEKGADYLADIGHWGRGAVFGAWAAMGETCAQGFLVDSGEPRDGGTWALEIFDRTTQADAIDDASPSTKIVGRFISATLNRDKNLQLDLFRAAMNLGQEELAEASISLLSAAHQSLRHAYEAGQLGEWGKA